MEWCEYCFNMFEGFDRCDSIVIMQALRDGEKTVALYVAGQAEVNKRRERLHLAALAQPEPIEILTVPYGKPGEVGLKVRRFK